MGVCVCALKRMTAIFESRSLGRTFRSLNKNCLPHFTISWQFVGPESQPVQQVQQQWTAENKNKNKNQKQKEQNQNQIKRNAFFSPACVFGASHNDDARNEHELARRYKNMRRGRESVGQETAGSRHHEKWKENSNKINKYIGTAEQQLA